MSDIRIIPWQSEEVARMGHGTCWALWREDLPCLNQATWWVQNLHNIGYSLMCDLHKEGFADAEPTAAVRYIRMETPPL